MRPCLVLLALSSCLCSWFCVWLYCLWCLKDLAQKPKSRESTRATNTKAAKAAKATKATKPRTEKSERQQPICVYISQTRRILKKHWKPKNKIPKLCHSAVSQPSKIEHVCSVWNKSKCCKSRAKPRCFPFMQQIPNSRGASDMMPASSARRFLSPSWFLLPQHLFSGVLRKTYWQWTIRLTLAWEQVCVSGGVLWLVWAKLRDMTTWYSNQRHRSFRFRSSLQVRKDLQAAGFAWLYFYDSSIAQN